jgi:hypothetical protein
MKIRSVLAAALVSLLSINAFANEEEKKDEVVVIEHTADIAHADEDDSEIVHEDEEQKDQK